MSLSMRYGQVRRGAWALGVIAALSFGACSPEERRFESTGAGGGGGAGGSAGCEPDTQRPCYSGPPGTEDVGVCKRGVQVCLPNGSGFGECGGEVLPQPENCLTAADEACDGPDDALACPPLGDGWLKTYGSTSAAQFINDMAVDPDGNLVVVGSFGGTIDMGTGPMASTGGYDILVAKIDPLGNALWAKRYGDASSQVAYAVAIDANGAIYVGGRMAGSVDFGDGVLTSAGGNDAFIAKLNADGDAVWSKRFGDTANEDLWALAVTKTNQVVAAGTFTGVVSFGGQNLSSQGGMDIYVAKLDESGFHVASRRFGGQGTDYVYDLALNDQDQVFLTGSFGSTIEFVPGAVLTSQGILDAYGAKLSPNLAPMWGQAWGDAAEQLGLSVAIASNGDALFAGTYRNSVTFGNEFLQAPSTTARPLYVARLATTGDVVRWAQSFGDEVSFIGSSRLAVNAADEIIIAASVEGGLDFGGGLLAAAEGVDPMLAKLNAEGKHLASRHVRRAPGNAPLANEVTALALLKSGDPVIGGNHRVPFLVDGKPVGSIDLKDGDAFLGRFLP